MKNIHIKGAIDLDNKTHSISLVEFEKQDYNCIKSFILEQYKQLDNPDFFIIDDIDTVLPDLFGNTGIICGVIIDHKIVAVQGVDLSKTNSDKLKSILYNYQIKNCAELGWTLTKKEYRNKGISQLLLKEIEKRIPTDYSLVVTIHPENYVAIKLFLNSGYIGVCLQQHFQLPRIFMVKNYRVMVDSENICITSSINELKELFRKEYVLYKLENNKYLKFYLKKFILGS